MGQKSAMVYRRCRFCGKLINIYVKMTIKRIRIDEECPVIHGWAVGRQKQLMLAIRIYRVWLCKNAGGRWLHENLIIHMYCNWCVCIYNKMWWQFLRLTKASVFYTIQREGPECIPSWMRNQRFDRFNLVQRAFHTSTITMDAPSATQILSSKLMTINLDMVTQKIVDFIKFDVGNVVIGSAFSNVNTSTTFLTI